MSEVNVYGPIVPVTAVLDELAEHIKTWMPSYLREVERVTGRDEGSLPAFRGPVHYSDRVRLTDLTGQTPALVLASPGVSGRPEKRGDRGAYDSRWAVGVAAVVSGNDWSTTRRLAGEYAACLRALLAQQADFGALGAYVAAWEDEAYDDLPPSGQRTLSSGTVTVSVMVEDVVHSHGGPPAPTLEDPGPWPGMAEGYPQVEVERR